MITTLFKRACLCAALISIVCIGIPNDTYAQWGPDTSGIDGGKLTAWGGIDHYDVKKQYDRDGETFEFPNESMEWSARFVGGVSYGFAEKEIAGRNTHFSGEAGISILSRKFDFGDNSSSENLSSTALENIFLGATATSRVSDKLNATVGLKYFHDLAPDDSDVGISDNQNAFAFSGLLGINPNEGFLIDIFWRCVMTLKGEIDYNEPSLEKTAGDIADSFDNGNYQNIKVGGSYRVVDGEKFKLWAGLSVITTLRSESEFGDFKQEDSNGSLYSFGPNLDLKLANGLGFKLDGSHDEYGQETGCFSLSGKNFLRPSKDFSLSFYKTF